jgi:hypothetical protein
LDIFHYLWNALKPFSSVKPENNPASNISISTDEKMEAREGLGKSRRIGSE